MRINRFIKRVLTYDNLYYVNFFIVFVCFVGAFFRWICVGFCGGCFMLGSVLGGHNWRKLCAVLCVSGFALAFGIGKQ